MTGLRFMMIEEMLIIFIVTAVLVLFPAVLHFIIKAYIKRFPARKGGGDEF